MTLASLRERLEKAEQGADELNALILCALAAPIGSHVEQSPINGAWCIYNGTMTRGGLPRLWERTGKWYRSEGWPVTSSVDAALALIELVLPGQRVCVDSGPTPRGHHAFIEPPTEPYSPHHATAPTPALALCLALIRALEAKETQQ